MNRIIGKSIKPWIREMEGHSEEPSLKTIAELEAILDMAFLQSQTNTHVISGKLRASGRKTSDVRRSPRIARFHGKIEYGNSVIDYAEYEARRGHNNPRVDWFNHPGHDNLDDLDFWLPEIDAVLIALMEE